MPSPAQHFTFFTGEPPFANSNPAVVIGNHLSSPPPRLTGLRADVGSIDEVLAKAMAKEPFERFDTCREFAAALTHDGVGLVSSTDDTRLATNLPAPLSGGAYEERTTTRSKSVITISRRTALIVGGIAALIAVGLVAFIGARLAQPPSAPPTASPPQPSSEPQIPGPAAPSSPVSPLPTTSSPIPITTPPTTTPPSRTPGMPPRPPGDLGLPTPMSSPACNGQAIVVLGSVTTPGQYAEGVQRLLNAHPGASYLRTDQSCPSLRQATEEGNPIYAVYRPGGTTLCAEVRAAGDGAYGKLLDYTTDPGYILC